MTTIRRLARLPDYLVIAVAALAAAYIATPRPLLSLHGVLPAGRKYAAAAVGTAVVVVLALSLIRRAPMLLRVPARMALYVAAGFLVLAAFGARERKKLLAFPVYPPRPQNSFADRVDQLPAERRARWAGLIMEHLVGENAQSSDPPPVPSDWPFPRDVDVALSADGHGGMEVWTRTGDGTAYCVTIPKAASSADSARDAAACDGRNSAPAGLAFRPARRSAPDAPPAPTASTQAPWLQYRSDPAKSGVRADTVELARDWRQHIDGPIRSTASVVGDLVLVGAHETGALTALDLRTGAPRWAVRLPNWVHQEAVSDGRTVIVGFGSVWGSVFGLEPSGVAAYDLDTGQRRWTKFDEASVMTSPLIRDSVLLYATAAGTLRKRSVRTGALLGQLELPGGVIMGPPAIAGDTMTLTLDRDVACAVEVSTLKRLWCRRFGTLTGMGHAGPTMLPGVVIVSGTVGLLGMSPGEFLQTFLALRWDVIKTAFYPEGGVGGQRFVALDLRDGKTRWASRLVAGSIAPVGHTAGTATIRDSIGVIVLPNADSIVAFRTATGATLWQASALASRGPPLVENGEVVLTGRDGEIEIRELLTGRLKCRMRRSVGYDRAGPTLAGNAVILANLAGEVEGMPLDALRSCNDQPTADAGPSR